MEKIAVLIPCYNEEKTIAKVVADAKAALPEAVVYVYDNNSTDRTVETAQAAGAVIRHEYVQGKGNVIRRMFREIEASCYIMVDGDDTYPMEFAPQMVDQVLHYNADMVVGDRLYTDIACGINGEVDTCVLFTGEAKPEDMADTPYPADYCFSNVKKLLQHCTEAL